MKYHREVDRKGVLADPETAFESTGIDQDASGLTAASLTPSCVAGIAEIWIKLRQKGALLTVLELIIFCASQVNKW